MKKFMMKVSVALLLALLALGMVGCPTSSDDPFVQLPPGSTDSGESRYTFTDTAEITEILFSGVESATLGTPAATAAGATAGAVTVFTKTSVPIAIKSKSRFEQRAPNTTNFVDQGNGAEIDWAVVDNVSSFTDADLFPEDLLDFTTDRVVVIKAISQDGSDTKYYVINVTVINVALTSITITGADSADTKTLTGSTAPAPASTWQAATPVQVLFAKDQPVAGFGIAAVAATIDSKTGVVSWAKASVFDTTDPVFGTTTPILFADTDSLIVKITDPDDANAAAYYRVIINLKQVGTIYYGSPNVDLDNIDAKWASVTSTFNIKKIYLNDGNPGADYVANPTTTGVAKALWDEQGIYVYVVITDDDVTTVGATEPNNAHERDSLEIFVQENFGGAYSSGGSQYRVGSTGNVSGDPTAAIDLLEEAITAGKVKAKMLSGTGYAIMVQVPWRFLGQYPITDGKKIGFELQINESLGNQNRRCVMVWNNIANSNYQNATNYAEITLDADGNTLTFPAAPPVINTQPQSITIPASGTDTLSVAASMTSGNPSDSLSYQWYKASTNSSSDTGTAIGGDSDTLSVTAPATGGDRDYYYVVITNTLTNTLGTTTASVTSARVYVMAESDAPLVMQFTAQDGGAQFAIFKFVLPAGEEWGNYTSVKASYYADSAQLTKRTRAIRLMGNYQESDFTDAGTYKYAQFGSGDYDTNKNAPYIMHEIGGWGADPANWSTDVGFAVTADKWFTLTYPLPGEAGSNPNTNFDAAANVDVVKPLATDTGPFYLGVGIPGTTGNPITTLIKNVTLVHKTDADKNVVSTGSGFNVPVFAGVATTDTVIDDVPDPVFGLPAVANASATGTLFTSGGDYAGAEPIQYDSKDWWIVSTGSGQGYAFPNPVSPFDGVDSDAFDDIKEYQLACSNGGYTRLHFDLATLNDYWNTAYTTVTITYEAKQLAGDNFEIQIRKGQGAPGGSGIATNPNITPTTTGTIVRDITNWDTTSWASICKNGNGSLLLRITSIELN